MPVKSHPIVPGEQGYTGGIQGPEGFSVLEVAAQTVDGIMDAALGMRPLRHLLRPATAILPANIIRNVTGLPKPSEIVEKFEDDIEDKLKGMKTGGPRLPRF